MDPTGQQPRQLEPRSGVGQLVALGVIVAVLVSCAVGVVAALGVPLLVKVLGSPGCGVS